MHDILIKKHLLSFIGKTIETVGFFQFKIVKSKDSIMIFRADHIVFDI